jgi:aldehyde:ferredoxin oxidoreductase
MDTSLFKLLSVDLTKKTVKISSVEDYAVYKYIGGSGLGAFLLSSSITKELDPLSPENPLLFMTGPLTGSPAHGFGRHVVCAKSPLTGIWGESSAGGNFGAFLTFSGFNGVRITGRSKEWVSLHIEGESVTFQDASEWRGLGTYETIKQLVGRNTSVATIGPAGENLVRFASIINDDGRAAARTGMGAVMGSKKLKAIAVKNVEADPPLFNEERFLEASRKAFNIIQDDYHTQSIRSSGTAGAVDVQQGYFGGLTSKYFTEAGFDCYSISGTTMSETILVGTSGCYRCAINCGRVVEVKDGRYSTPGKVRGPEYETIGAFGSSLLNGNLESIAKANYLCDDYGMDTLSCGLAISLAYMLYDKGILTEDKMGRRLEWGDPDPALDLITDIAMRKGDLPYTLGEGSRAVGERFGASPFVAHVKGLDVSFQDPRAFSGMATIYATGSRGGCHTQGDMFMLDIGLEYPEIDAVVKDRFENNGKGVLAAKIQDYRSFSNSLILCYLYYYPITSVLEMYNYATGRDISVLEMMKIGERISNLKRLINCRLGVTREDDRLPQSYLSPLQGPTDGHVPDVDVQLRDYYDYRRWNWDTGRPSESKLKELEII